MNFEIKSIGPLNSTFHIPIQCMRPPMVHKKCKTIEFGEVWNGNLICCTACEMKGGHKYYQSIESCQEKYKTSLQKLNCLSHFGMSEQQYANGNLSSRTFQELDCLFPFIQNIFDHWTSWLLFHVELSWLHIS